MSRNKLSCYTHHICWHNMSLCMQPMDALLRLWQKVFAGVACEIRDFNEREGFQLQLFTYDADKR